MDESKYGPMDLRDWMAGQAITAVVYRFEHATNPNAARIKADKVASEAYKIADAMLKARTVMPGPF